MELGLKGASSGDLRSNHPHNVRHAAVYDPELALRHEGHPHDPHCVSPEPHLPASVDYLISEFETVLTILYTITGNMVSEKSMEEAIAVYNQHNATMREFDTAANDHLDVITPKVRHVVHKSAFFFEKESTPPWCRRSSPD